MKAPHLSVELVVDHTSVPSPGTLQAGIFFKLDKDWHVYWMNPGDSGETPHVQWNLPEGITAGSILWPTPKRIEVGPLVNYGYENEVLLPMPMTIASGVQAGTVQLDANVSWLVCADICVPGKAHLTRSLSVHDGAAVEDDEWSPIFEATQKMIPDPQPANWKLSGSLTQDTISLSIQGLTTRPASVTFFPSQGDVIDNAAKPVLKISEHEINLQAKTSDRIAQVLTEVPGVLVMTQTQGSTLSTAVNFPLHAPALGGQGSGSLEFFVGCAFIGGLLLNLMPCVFPVLSLKVMSLLKMSGEHRLHNRKMGWAYTLGILSSFWLLTGALVGLRAAGSQIGWGFQLQSPRFVFVLACVLFGFGLSLLGLFEVSGSFMGAGTALANRKGLIGSFFTGVLATLVATPCTAPFMGSAVGFALTQSSFGVFLVFTSIALGLALPYLLVSYIPQAGRFLPKPGMWMETFKELMSFLIFGTVIWLAWVLSLQVSVSGVILLISAFLGIGFSAWIGHRWPRSKRAQYVAIIIGLAVIVTATFKVGALSPALSSGLQQTDGLTWEKFSPERVSELRSQGRPVFVDFTAAWCVSCQVNELLVFKSVEVQTKLKELGFALLKADWTNEDPIITKTLASFGRDGVPFYVIYGKEKDSPAIPLPEVINAGIVLKELEKLK